MADIFENGMNKNSDIFSTGLENQVKESGNKNIFHRGDFDEYKISDEELKEHEIEKGFTKREFVNGNGKRKSYWRTRTYEGIEGKTNNFKGKNTKIIEDRKKEIKARNNLLKIMTEDFYNFCKSHSENEVKTTYSDGNFKPILNIPYRFMNLFPYAKDSFVYCGTQTLGVHINRHNDVSLSIFQDMQKVINNTNNVYQEKVATNLNGQKGIAFEVMDFRGERYAMVVRTDKYGRLVFWKSFHIQRNVQEKWKKINLARLKQGFNKSGEGGQFSISQTSKASSSDLSTFPDNLIIAKSQNMSSNVQKSLTFSGHKLQGRTKLYGMDISIENKKGSYRTGTDKDGHKWRTLMHYDYGYIRGTVGTDGDHVDVYIGPYKDAEKVYVIHQNDPVTHKYDEDKCMICFESAADAKKAYMKQYDRPGFFGSMDTLTVDQFKSFVFSKQGSRIHKSFTIEVTDITENNKAKKIDQVEKALNAVYKNEPFIVKHIPAEKGGVRIDNIVMTISNFDRNKIEKAVHSMAFSLDTTIKAAKGEAFVYKSQEQLTDKIVTELTENTKQIYSFVISYFGLPEIRVVSKALKYKGVTIYDPETGKPIKTSDWFKFVKALQKLIDKLYKGSGKKIVLNSQTLGTILERLSKTQSLEAIKKMQLDKLKYSGKTFDWISSDVKNMVDIFGDTVDRQRAARIQIATESAAQRVTKVTDELRNDIQQTIIDGIKNRESRSKISQNLFNQCVKHNRDFQKIADTEIQNNTNNAYVKEAVYHAKDGEKVYFKRFEVVDDNTCKYCKTLKGKIAVFSEVPLPDENINDPYADYAIWEGKEEGKAPMGTLHPYCRGCWYRYYPEV